MNRFEQESPHYVRKIISLLSIGAFLLLFLLFLHGINSINEVTLAKQKDNLETALSRSITQCYVIEGVYPPSLEYLTTHYGLLYNDEIFLIDYEYAGSNLMPEVRVRRRQPDNNK